MGDQYHLLMPDPLSSIPLPDPARLTIQIRDNWWLQEPTTDAEPDDHPAPPPPAPSYAARSSRGPRPDASTVDALQRILDQQQQLLDGQTELRDRQTQLQDTVDNMAHILQHPPTHARLVRDSRPLLSPPQ
ncbi:hypothetical protein Salat_1675000 [Sesamum alatum]|uniref:Uncharacterized protein n=1 Tax=Sesamum alatum TaxID=300844 RepID=A0AAE1Y7J6_9LAMI|nr:hypothetical protein Salat_1675000 [Sesamum alatum]